MVGALFAEGGIGDRAPRPSRAMTRLLLSAGNTPAPLSIAIREEGAHDLPQKAVWNAPVYDRGRGATGDWPKVGARPHESICLRSYDPRRRVIETDPTLGVLRKRDGIAWPRWWGVGDGKDEEPGWSPRPP